MGILYIIKHRDRKFNNKVQAINGRTSKMIFKNGLVMCDDFKLRKKDIKIENGIIAEIGDKIDGDNVKDFSGKYILPGFIDTHIHGSFGVRVSDKDADYDKLCRFLASRGITSFAPTTASSTIDSLVSQVATAKKNADNKAGCKIYGIHLEGPFLNKLFKGAMNEECIVSPSAEAFDKLWEAGGGLIKIISMAPEVPGGMEFVEYAVKKGISVSIGHTNATYDEAKLSFDKGIRQATHTFNAMRPYNHREPGVLGAVLTDERIKCEMICDYVHLHEKTNEIIYRLKGADNINIISDSEVMTGVDVTEFEADGYMHYIKDGVIRLADGTISGSAKTMADGVKNLLLSGLPICDVSKMASKNPAQTLSVYDITGSIQVGKCADIAILDTDYTVVKTFVDGKEY